MRLGICGFINDDIKVVGGQPLKTQHLLNALAGKLGAENITFLNTKKWKLNPVSLFIKTFELHKKNDIILFLPAQNGVKILSRLFLFYNKFRKRNLHYIVVGGWLPNLLKREKGLFNSLRKLDGIHVETTTMQTELNKMGLLNVNIVRNFRKSKPAMYDLIFDLDKSSFHFCYFSRVIRQKGIEDAIQAIKTINTSRVDKKCYLDIYGPIEESYKRDIFYQIDSEYINYKGIVESDLSSDILKSYFMQIFPTKYYTEGIPGSIIDSYFASLPIISSKWESFSDVVEDGVTGLGYEFNQIEDLISKIEWAIENPNEITKMKNECLKYSLMYVEETVIEDLLNYIKGSRR